MSPRNDFIRRLGAATWPSELVFGPQDAQRWDAAQYRSVNGDDGGTWAPTKPVIIGGSLTTALALTTSGSLLSGGAKTIRGGRIGLGANDFPVVTPNRTRTLTWHLWEMQHPSTPPTALDAAGYAFYAGDTGFGINPGNALREIAIPSKFLHNGAQLQSITARFRIPSLPTVAAMANAHLILTMFQVSANGTVGNFPNGLAAGLMAIWQTAHVYALGSYVTPTTANQNGLYYKATSVSGTGTSGGSEPTWPTTIGATVTDNPGANQIVWTCVGASGRGSFKQLNDPATLYASGQPQSLTFAMDSAVSNTIDTTANYYGIEIEIGPAAIMHSIQFTYGGIGSLAFE